jgi:octaprenyl-diphosphate synthase
LVKETNFTPLNSLEEIQQPVANEMQLFEEHFKKSMKSDHQLLDKIAHYIIKRKGKQMRPMFVFLSAGMCGKINDSTFTASSLIELLHTATLVHDDVVDDAGTRRGFFSVNALWKNKIAVLVGDYLLSRGLLMSVDKGEFELLRIVSNAVREMSEGELLQQQKARLLNITEPVYFEIIRQKTASLIAACCESGGLSGGADLAQRKLLSEFGLYVGMAFQIKDDLLDYGFGEKIGKPIGIDIKERKLTLPLIHALREADRSLRNDLMSIVRKHNTDAKKVQHLVNAVSELGGIQYANDKMIEFVEKARHILREFHPSVYRNSLEQLVDFTIQRKK